MKEPLVYIIILNFNGAEDTIECVKSLEKITYNNYKIIVIDNCSTDNSESILKNELKEYRIIETKINNGFSAGNNVGIKIALSEGADYILLLNNDTVVEPDFLSELVYNSMDYSNVGISIGKIYYYFHKKRLWYAGGKINLYKGRAEHFGYNDIDNDKYNYKKSILFATGCCMLISKYVFAKVGLMSEDYFLYYEDTDYSYKIISNNFKILFIPSSVIYHKVSASTGNMSKLSQYYYSRNRLLFIKKNIKNPLKIISYIYFFAENIAKILIGKLEFKPTYLGVKDFFRKNFGKNKMYI